jgi:hypothetical protein
MTSEVTKTWKHGVGWVNNGSPDPNVRRNQVGILLSEVEAEQVSWLWTGRIPLGKLTVLDGDPGRGKSALLTDAAARVSVGLPWPDGSPCEASGVVILSAEDGLADTIRPRLDAAGGDPAKVLSLTSVPNGDGGEMLISLPEDLNRLRRGIERMDARLVIVDPLMAFLSGDVNSYKDQDVRRALTPFAKLAEETGTAVVVVRHMNKAIGGSALYRGGGSIGIVGAARSAFVVGQDPDDENWRVLAPVKGNLAKPPSSLRFTLVEAANGAVRVEYGGESDYGADDLLAPRGNGKGNAVAKAKAFLLIILKGRRVLVSDIKELAKVVDISWRSVERARKDLPIEAKREGKPGKRGGGAWFWQLREEVDPGDANGGGLNGQLSLPERLEEEPAFLSQEADAGLRPPTPNRVKAASPDDGLDGRPLTREEAQEYLTLRAQGLDPDEARRRLLEGAT